MFLNNHLLKMYIVMSVFMPSTILIGAEQVPSSSLVLISSINPAIRHDLIYATTRNFTGKIIYTNAKAYLIKEAAYALDAVQKDLEKLGLGLLIWDAYRPLSAQRKLWQVCPDPRYVADPSKGGYHTRGVAVDLTLIRLSDGTPLEMPTGFDDFSEKASRNCKNIAPQAQKNSELLLQVMTKHGFKPYACEWWHFNYGDITKYPPLDIDFEMLS